MNNSSSRRTLSFVLAFALAGGLATARAADPAPQNYGVMSLIGDQISIVTYRPAVGSSLDVNQKQAVAMTDDSFDRAAVAAADDAIKRAVPGAAATLLLVSDKELYARQGELFESDEQSKALIDTIGAHLKDKSVRYLVLITKFRSETRMQFARDRVGSGKLSGLGFYLDYSKRTTRGDNRSIGCRLRRAVRLSRREPHRSTNRIVDPHASGARVESFVERSIDHFG